MFYRSSEALPAVKPGQLLNQDNRWRKRSPEKS